MDLQNQIVYDTLNTGKDLDEKTFKTFLNDACDAYYTAEPFISDSEFDKFRQAFKNRYGQA